MAGLIRFLRNDLWRDDLRTKPFWMRFLVSVVRAVVHVALMLNEHFIGTRAGSLTVTTMLAMVPLAAMVFSVANGFGFGDELDTTLVEFSQELPPQLVDVIDQVRVLVASVDFAKLGVLSTLLVLYTGLSLFINIERALNHAWLAAATRSWVRRLTDFVAVVVIVPGLAVGAVTLSSVLQSAGKLDTLQDYSWLGWLYDAGLGFVPFVMLGIAFTALYKFMPNTTVHWRSAAIGGFVAGTALLWMNTLYISLQIGVAQNNAIYATLAALPLLIVYLQLAWTIVLIGAELAHAVQNADLLGSGRQFENASPALRERVALALTERATTAFANGEGGIELAVAATDLDMPRSVVDSICADLVAAHVLVATDSDQVLPGRPPSDISIDDVRRAIRGDVPEDVRDRLGLDERLEEALEGADRDQRSSLGRVRYFVAS